ncbi:MAG: glycosyltransferase family 4 protein [Thermoanaerobaculia bacterium]
MKPRIAVVCRGAGGEGSVARAALRQASELAGAFAVHVISDSFPTAGEGPFERVVIAPREFRFLRRFAHVPNEISFARAARAALERTRPDFVVTHAHAVALLAALPLRQRTGARFALVTHGDIFDRPEGMYDSRLAAFYRYVTPRAYRAADLVVALSPYMADFAVAGGARRVEVVPNGIDGRELGLAGTTTTHAGAQEGPLRLLYVGRLSVEKGVEHLLAACELLSNRGVAYSLTLVGAGPRLEPLRRAAAAHPEIRFLPARERAELGAIYSSADLVCIPSLSEALPGVALEALVAGTPVLATDTGGNRFIVVDGENGVLVQPGSAVAIADAIEALARDRGRLQRLARNSVASAERFRWDVVGARLTALIREHLG